jgi:hypothetical protein
MDIDSGNLSTVAQVKSEEQGRNIEVDLEKTSFDEGKAHSQTNAHGVEEAEDNDHSKLPFSVTRSMFFVLSLTGAAFLNVSCTEGRAKYRITQNSGNSIKAAVYVNPACSILTPIVERPPSSCAIMASIPRPLFNLISLTKFSTTDSRRSGRCHNITKHRPSTQCALVKTTMDYLRLLVDFWMFPVALWPHR